MTTEVIRLLSWNVAHRNNSAEQVAQIVRLSPDIIALQEVTRRSVVILGDCLSEGGFKCLANSFYEPRQADAYGVLIASKWPVERIPAPVSEPHRQRLLNTTVTTPSGRIEVSAAYVKPGSSDARVKLETLEYIYTKFEGKSRRSRILCGDFNAPQAETSDGSIVTWGQRLDRDTNKILTKKRWRGMPGERYDKAERNILEGLQAGAGLTELFRHFHPGEVQDFSWYNTKGQGRRFDHIFASKNLNPVSCCYHHEVREKRISDHSAIEAEFRPPSTK